MERTVDGTVTLSLESYNQLLETALLFDHALAISVSSETVFLDLDSRLLFEFITEKCKERIDLQSGTYTLDFDRSYNHRMSNCIGQLNNE